MNSDKYVGVDVHEATLVVHVMDGRGKFVMESIIEPNATRIRDFFRALRGTVHVAFEEGTQAAWLYDLISPLVAQTVVCDPRSNKLLHSGNKSDKVDAKKLAELLRLGDLRPVYHGDSSTRALKELVRGYGCLVVDCTRVMNRIKSVFRGRGIRCRGSNVYRRDVRDKWLEQVKESARRDRLNRLYRELDTLKELRDEARKGMLKEARRHSDYQIIKKVPGLGPVRAAQIIAIVSTPHRFRTKRQFWPYCGLAVVTHSSADYELVGGEVRRRKKVIATRGLNRNFNRTLKNVFKSAAESAIRNEEFKKYHQGLMDKRMRPEMARLTVARKIAAITLALWKKKEEFDPERMNQAEQSAGDLS